MVKSGVQLIGTGGASVTIIDASAANPRVRVLECHGNATTTLIQGFTITGGLVQPTSGDALGGGILCDTADQTTISRNIITGNQALGQGSTSPAGFAYGGGIYVSGTNSIVNNVISNNTAHGGDGGFLVAGGAAHGGGVYASGGVSLVNNTFNGNFATGGNGNAPTSTNGGGYSGAAIDGAGNVLPSVVNDIISNNTGAAGTGGIPSPQAGAVTGTMTPTNSLFFNNVGGDGNTGTLAILANPKFVSGIDFHILFSSLAKFAGTATGAPTVDLDGKTRPNPPSIGAFEPGGGVRRADFNMDGKSDVLWRKSTTGEDAMWLMNGVTISSPAALVTISDTNWKIAGVGDFNGDGRADVIWLHNLTGQVVIWLMNSTSLSSAATVTTVSNTNWKIVGVGDVNNDGNSDVFWRNSATGETVVWLMNGTSISSAAYLTTVSDLNWNVVGVGDFNGDGMTDVFWRNGATGQNVVWLMNGASIGSAAFTNTVADLNYKVVGVGDVNGDGKADVVWWNQATGDVAVWLMNGATPSSAGLITTVSDLNWHVEGVGDFDGDGKADLIWRKVTSGEVVAWLMNGLSIKQAAFVTQVNDLNWSIVAPR